MTSFRAFEPTECGMAHFLRRPVNWYAAKWEEAVNLTSAQERTLVGADSLPQPMLAQFKSAVTRLSSAQDYLKSLLPEVSVHYGEQRKDECKWINVRAAETKQLNECLTPTTPPKKKTKCV